MEMKRDLKEHAHELLNIVLGEGFASSPAEARGELARLNRTRVAHLKAEEELLKLPDNGRVLLLLLVLRETLLHAKIRVGRVRLALRQLLLKVVLNPLIEIPTSII